MPLRVEQGEPEVQVGLEWVTVPGVPEEEQAGLALEWQAAVAELAAPGSGGAAQAELAAAWPSEWGLVSVLLQPPERAQAVAAAVVEQAVREVGVAAVEPAVGAVAPAQEEQVLVGAVVPVAVETQLDCLPRDPSRDPRDLGHWHPTPRAYQEAKYLRDPQR